MIFYSRFQKQTSPRNEHPTETTFLTEPTFASLSAVFRTRSPDEGSACVPSFRPTSGGIYDVCRRNSQQIPVKQRAGSAHKRTMMKCMNHLTGKPWIWMDVSLLPPVRLPRKRQLSRALMRDVLASDPPDRTKKGRERAHASVTSIYMAMNVPYLPLPPTRSDISSI